MSTEPAAPPSPAAEPRLGGGLGLAFHLLVAAGLLTALWLAFFEAPREREMGEVQRIFYFHVASAFAALLCFITCAAASLGYLVLQGNRGLAWFARGADRYAQAAGEVGVLFGLIVLLTGPLWAKPAWGVYWTWEPRLVLMLLTVFLFVGYVGLRNGASRSETARRIAAGVAVIGGPAVYLIHVAVELWGGNHPQVVTGQGGGLQAGAMQLAFAVSVLAVLAFTGALMALRMGELKLRDALDTAWIDLSDLEGEDPA
jgi:heme exporter protein C